MEELLKLSLREIDPVNGHAMYCEMQTLVHENCGMVIPVFANVIMSASNRLHGMPQTALGQFGRSEWLEFVWVDDA